MLLSAMDPAPFKRATHFTVKLKVDIVMITNHEFVIITTLDFLTLHLTHFRV